MEVISSACDTAAHKFTVILEIHGKQSFSRRHITDFTDTGTHVNSLLRCRKQINRRIVSDRHIVKIQRITAAFFNH